MLRRNLIKAALASALISSLVPASAREAVAFRPIHVVEVVNFGCPYCRSMEAMNPEIQATVERAGGRFIFAPLTWGEGSSEARDFVYYASRGQGDAVESPVRSALYKASQDIQLPLENISQVLVYLKQEIHAAPVDWEKLETESYSEASRNASQRAKNLAVEAGVNHVPAYIFVQSGKILGIVDRSGFSSTPEFRRAVLNKYRALQREGGNHELQ